MRVNQSAFQKLKRPTVRVCLFFLFFLKTCMDLRGCPPTVSVSITNSIFSLHFSWQQWDEKQVVCLKKKRKMGSPPLPPPLGGPAACPVLTRVEPADQPLDALQLVRRVFLRASLWRHGDRVAGHLRRGIQGDPGRRAGRHDAVSSLRLGPAAAHVGHRGGEQGAVRHRHGEGVRAVPESGTHCVQERVPVRRGGGGGGGGGGCRRGGHVRVRVREQASERRHGEALRRKRRSAVWATRVVGHFCAPQERTM